MVAAGFLDLEVALDIVRRPLCLVINRDLQEVKVITFKAILIYILWLISL